MIDEQTESSASAEIVRTTRRARLLLSAAVLLVLAFFLLCQFVAIPFLKAELDIAQASNLAVVKNILAGFGVIATLAGLCTILYGRKIIVGGQYPPANAWVWRDTLIKRGRIATQFGWFHIAAGACMIIIGLGSTIYLWHLIDQSLPHFKSDKHFTILQQKSNI
jgi:hypothetical protein